MVEETLEQASVPVKSSVPWIISLCLGWGGSELWHGSTLPCLLSGPDVWQKDELQAPLRFSVPDVTYTQLLTILRA